jgi:hypothetical protein
LEKYFMACDHPKLNLAWAGVEVNAYRGWNDVPVSVMLSRVEGRGSEHRAARGWNLSRFPLKLLAAAADNRYGLRR